MGEPRNLLLAFLGLALLAGVLFWPRWGLFIVAFRRLRTTDRTVAEDVLKHLFHHGSDGLATALVLTQRRAERYLAFLESRGLVKREGRMVSLTSLGRTHAVHLVRAHRLWECYLADRTGVEPRDWHELAEQAEHWLTPEATSRLADRMGRPAFDPHGDPIPASDGTLLQVDGGPLTELSAGRTAEIMHIEDEPRTVYEKLLDAGLAPGERLTLIARDAAWVTFVAGGRRSTLSVSDAVNVTVRDRADATPEAEHPTLAELAPGEGGRVIAIASSCRSAQRRRLLDLGLVPGTEVVAEMRSAMGDPVAYRVRGALIALRRQQAEWIMIDRPAAAMGN